MFCLSLTFRFIVSQSRYFAIIKAHKHLLKTLSFMLEASTSIFNNISLKTKFKMKRWICNTSSAMIKLLTILSSFCQKTNFSNFVAILISFNHQAKMHLLFIWVIYSLFSIIYFYSSLHFIFIIIISHYFEFIEKHFQNVIHIWTTSQTSQTSSFLVFNHARSVWKIRVWIARFSSSSFERIFSTCFENVAFLILSLFSNQILRNFIIISWLSITSFLHLNNILILRYFSKRKKFYIHFNNKFFTIEQYSNFTIFYERRFVIN